MKSRVRLLIIFLVVVCMVEAGNTYAMPILDQQSVGTPTTTYMKAGSNIKWQQGLTVGLTGQLTSMDIWFMTTEAINVSLYSGAPWQTSSALFTSTFNPLFDQWTNIDVSSAVVNVTAGDFLTIAVDGPMPNNALMKGTQTWDRRLVSRRHTI